jgi:hypothetical protein
MRQLMVLIGITTCLNLSCTSSRSKWDKTEIDYAGIYKVDSAYRELSVDKALLERVVMNNRDFFKTYTEHIYAQDKNQEHGEFMPDLYKVIGYKECGQFQHWLILKSRNNEGFDIEPYKGIFFIITDKHQKGISNLKLAEDSHTLMLTSSKDSIRSIVSSDNVAITKTIMNYGSCSPAKKGGPLNWTKVIITMSRISCDKIEKIKSDTTVTED